MKLEDLKSDEETLEKILEEINSKDRKSVARAKEFLSKVLPNFPPISIDNCLKDAEITLSSKVNKEDISKFSQIAQKGIEEFLVFRKNNKFEGYLIKDDMDRYCDFSPILYKSYPTEKSEKIETYNQSLDKYFNAISIKVDINPEDEVKKKAWKKYENIKVIYFNSARSGK